jgi:hypothetical protein
VRQVHVTPPLRICSAELAFAELTWRLYHKYMARSVSRGFRAFAEHGWGQQGDFALSRSTDGGSTLSRMLRGASAAASMGNFCRRKRAPTCLRIYVFSLTTLSRFRGARTPPEIGAISPPP